MADLDPVPEADREEQALPPTADPRTGHRHPDDVPEADVLEQEVPVVDEPPATGLDAERTEDDEDWSGERREPGEQATGSDWPDQHTEP